MGAVQRTREMTLPGSLFTRHFEYQYDRRRVSVPDIGKFAKKEDIAEFVRQVKAIRAENQPRRWGGSSYNKQKPPDHPDHGLIDPRTGRQCRCQGQYTSYKTWILMTGRGFGKTRAGANWVLEKGLANPGAWIACCAPTFSDVKNTCFEGPSGILEQAEDGEVVSYNKNDMRITLRNGAVIQGYSADRAESIRGANLSYCWFDEIGIIRYPEFYTYGLLPALRVGERQLLVTTTPRKTKTMRELLDAAEKNPEHVHLTQATSWENWKAEGVQEMIEAVTLQFHGNQLLIDQELEGKFIEAVPGALFIQEDFDQYRVEEKDLPDFRRVVISVDPAQTSTKDSDETGIVVAAEGEDRHFYVLEDLTLQGSPDRVTGEIVKAYHRWQADLVIGEKNAIGDYFPAVLYQKDPHIPFRSVYVMKGKQIRAQPVSVINERGLIHMVGGRDDFSKMEQQLCAMTSFDDRKKVNDDRADAFVFALRELMGVSSVNYAEVYGFIPCPQCKQDVNYLQDKKCRHCGADVAKREIPQTERVRSAMRWSNAYMRKCPEGHEYSLRFTRCPKCGGDAMEYLKQVAAFSQSEGSWIGYSERNWLSGRKF